MNWKEIKKKYPKAYKELTNCFGYKNETAIEISLTVYYNRNLYDFFDEKGIYIVVHPDILNEVFFIWIIFDEKNRAYQCNPEKFVNNRQEAERAAFLKAFEILEQKL